MPYLDRDGVRVHYDVAGDGPVVLLTHGFGASSQMFVPNVLALSKDHTVITWDLRGHGGTDYPLDPAKYSVPLTVADMAALLDTVGAERAVIAGHSVGGFLSLQFNLVHPDRVQALVLIDTGPGFRGDEPRAGWNRFVENYAGRLSRDGLATLGGSEELVGVVHRDATGLVLAARGILAQHDSRVIDSLAGIDVPTLVIVGAGDQLFLDGSRYMAGKIPDSTLVVIEGAGHAPNVSCPEVFNDHVTRFLRVGATHG